MDMDNLISGVLIQESLSLVPDDFVVYYMTNVEYDTVTIVHRHGVCICQLSWYHDNPSEVILGSLDVSPAFRRMGYGLMLQELRENMGRVLGARRSTLWAVDTDWVRA